MPRTLPSRLRSPEPRSPPIFSAVRHSGLDEPRLVGKRLSPASVRLADGILVYTGELGFDRVRIPFLAFGGDRRSLLSLRLDAAAARKPCEVISSWLKPRRRRAALRVFSLMQRAAEWTERNRKRAFPVIACRLRRTSTARGASGTRWSRRIFIFSAGTTQSARSRSNSRHSAERISPGRTKVRASNSRAARVAGAPP